MALAQASHLFELFQRGVDLLHARVVLDLLQARRGHVRDVGAGPALERQLHVGRREELLYHTCRSSRVVNWGVWLALGGGRGCR